MRSRIRCPATPCSRTLSWPSSAHRTKVASPSGHGRLSCPASRSADRTRASRTRTEGTQPRLGDQQRSVHDGCALCRISCVRKTLSGGDHSGPGPGSNSSSLRAVAARARTHPSARRSWSPPLPGQHQAATDDHQQHERERKTRGSQIHGSAALSTATWHRRRISQNRADPRGSSGVCSSRCTPDRGRSDHRRTDRAHPGTVPARVDRALRGRRLVPTARAPCPARPGPARCPGTGGNSRSRYLVARSCAVRFRQRDSSSISLSFPGTSMRATRVIPAARAAHNCGRDDFSRVQGRRKDRATPGQQPDHLMQRGRR
jgi:hypothetical protein